MLARQIADLAILLVLRRASIGRNDTVGVKVAQSTSAVPVSGNRVDMDVVGKRAWHAFEPFEVDLHLCALATLARGERDVPRYV